MNNNRLGRNCVTQNSVDIWRNTMKSRHIAFLILILWGVSIYAQKSPKEILQNAIIRDATLNYSYEKAPKKNDRHICIVKQRRNPDGSVWHVTDSKRTKEYSRAFWSFDVKDIYNSDGHIDLWISQFETYGIVTQEEHPHHIIRNDSTFKMTSVNFDGRNCWKIIESETSGYVQEFIIDKKHEFILVDNTYDSSGRLLFSEHRININFNPVYSEDDFTVPPNAKLKHARNSDEAVELLQKRAFRHSDFVIKKRQQLANTTPKPHGRLRRQWDRLTNYNTFNFICQKAPWFMMPIFIASIGIIIWKKKKNKEG